jgi:hypothetical protein
MDEQKCHIDAVGDNVIQELPHGSPPQGLFGSGCLILASPCEFSALDRERLSLV